MTALFSATARAAAADTSIEHIDEIYEYNDPPFVQTAEGGIFRNEE